MKKSLIVTGAASLAMAAMPVVGVFAVDTSTSQSFTDNIKVTVPTGCTMENSAATGGTTSYADRNFVVEIPVGSYKEFGNNDTGTADGTISISCNEQSSSKSWTVKATASTDEASENPKAALKHGSSDFIKGGTATTGATSTWAMQLEVTGTGASSATNNYATWAAVPATANTAVLTAPTNTSNVSFRPMYRVYVAPDQVPGDYEGTVVYTIEVSQS